MRLIELFIPIIPTNVKQVSFKTARRIIKEYHYLKYVPPGCKFCLGIFAKHYLAGVMIFGHPIARLEDQNNTLELTRMFLYDSPKNSESRALGLAEKWIKQHRSETRIIAYTDTQQGHTGMIYLAANWTKIGIVPIGSWSNRKNRRGKIGGDKIKFERILRKKKPRALYNIYRQTEIICDQGVEIL